VDYFSCEAPSDGIVRAVSCGAATRGDAIAIHRDQGTAYSAAFCGPEGMMCPAWASTNDPTLVATCGAGQCTVVDRLEAEVTACVTVDDGRVRSVDGCECGGRVEAPWWIAVSTTTDALYSALVCDADVACIACTPESPSVTLDGVSGHCAIVP
jgi:hypothetical protein